MAIKATHKNQEFFVGDEIIINCQVKEDKKTRIQKIAGRVIAIKGRKEGKTFTLRQIGADGIGFERIWPLNSPVIKKIIIRAKGRVRRAKLYYLRQRTGKKAAKLKSS